MFISQLLSCWEFAFLNWIRIYFPKLRIPHSCRRFCWGVAVAATAIIPGVDPAVFLSTLGLYRAYVAALADFDLSILLPMLIGLGVGAVVISFCMSTLFKHFYTATYSVIFGIFLCMIPNILSENCVLGFNGVSVISILLLIVGFLISYFGGRGLRN